MTLMRTESRDGLDTLVDYVLQTASRNPGLLEQRVKTATLNDLVTRDVLIVENEAQARISLLVAEALIEMGKTMHEEDDRYIETAQLTRKRTLVLIREHGGLRPAARALGVSKSALERALEREEVVA